jgi:hypothetical protein
MLGSPTGSPFSTQGLLSYDAYANTAFAVILTRNLHIPLAYPRVKLPIRAILIGKASAICLGIRLRR